MITVGLAAFAKPNNSTRIAAATNFTNYNGVLVEPCSIMKPLIKFEGVQAWNYNYAYISQFSRYYFIDDYYTENGFWFAQMTVDVLASFKTAIGTSTQYIERAANKQNAYALDGGQTTVITMCGDLISRPDFEHQRQISDIIYFATAIPNGD